MTQDIEVMSDQPHLYNREQGNQILPQTSLAMMHM